MVGRGPRKRPLSFGPFCLELGSLARAGGRGASRETQVAIEPRGPSDRRPTLPHVDTVDELLEDWRHIANAAGEFSLEQAAALIRCAYGKGYLAGLAEAETDPQAAALEARKAMARLP